MKLNSHSLIEGCVSTDPCRESINHVWLDVDKKRVISTDGRMMAVVPVEVDEHDTSGPVTVEAIKAARKLTGKNLPKTIMANGSLALTNGASFPRPQALKAPNFDQVLPAEDRPVCFKVGLDAELLYRLAKALSNGQNTFVSMEFENDTSAIKVKGSNGEAIGVLMPARIQ